MSFHQYDFVKKMWNDMPMELKGKYRRTQAREDLFKVDLNSELLENNKKNMCHRVTAKYLWLSQRTRVDLQLSTGLYCTRFKSTTVEDWLKLKRSLGCLWSTRFLPMRIAIDKDGNSMKCTDCSHATHTDGKLHSGLFITMVNGAMTNVSKKLGLVKMSSTEIGVVSTGE